MGHLDQVEKLLNDFAGRSGLDRRAASRRYLWTDAFAVCADISLHLARRDDAFLDRARSLVDQVHDVLGAYAANDARSGWLGGRTDAEHAATPTRAGLRIGKQHPEREPGEAFDQCLEWDRDGQYFHYLTRWMHAWERMAETTGETRYHRWAVDLARAAFEGFVHRRPGSGGLRMFWKMSVDLDRPQVPSMGQHDPLDGWVLMQTLLASAHGSESERRELRDYAEVYWAMFDGGDLTTGDALGIGGLLVDAWQLSRLPSAGYGVESRQVSELLDAAALGLEHVVAQRQLHTPPAQRLAFRELGLATGLRAAERSTSVRSASSDRGLATALARIAERLPLADDIERTWLAAKNRQLPSWIGHRAINDVMLATCLAPAGYLGPAPEGESQQEVHS